MKCNKPDFLNLDLSFKKKGDEALPELPDSLTDYITGREIPFSNKDNIRQRVLKFLVEEKGYLNDDISTGGEIRFVIEGMDICSPVDISIRLHNKTLMVWKCASGSLVSRERQIIATARLLEDYFVPFAVVTNGKDLELLDSSSEKVIGEGFDSLPARQELLIISEGLSFDSTKRKKIMKEERILFTYDAICCPLGSRANFDPLHGPRQKKSS
jgi:hypothetical protein